MPPRATQEMLRVFLPQVSIVVLLIVYLIFGAFLFTCFDEKMANAHFSDVILFAFTTITTIGYGHIAPSTTAGQLFCIGYAIFGMPLAFLTLANLGKYLTKCYWMLMVCLGRRIRQRPSGEAKMPIATILLIILVTFVFGSVLFHHRGRKWTFDDIYFSFISFTTVGFGDKIPFIGSNLRLIAMTCYLAWGIVLMSTLIAVISHYLRRIHYLGRRLKGTKDVNVWFGGQQMSVSDLLRVVADKFKASPKELRKVLHDLDTIVGKTIEIQQHQHTLNALGSTIRLMKHGVNMAGESLLGPAITVDEHRQSTNIGERRNFGDGGNCQRYRKNDDDDTRKLLPVNCNNLTKNDRQMIDIKNHQRKGRRQSIP